MLVLCASITAQATPTVAGDTARYKSIIAQMESQMDKNYDLDFRYPTQYSEYRYLNSSKELLQAIYIEGQQLSVRDVTQTPPKVHFPKYWLALGYKLDSTIHLPSWFGISRGQSLLSWLLDDLTDRKKGEGVIDVNYFFHKNSDECYSYAVRDTLYEGVLCYKLVCKVQEHCGEDLRNTTWAGTRETVIRKDDYAVVYFCATFYEKQKKANTWELSSKWEEKFAKMSATNAYQRMLCTFYVCDANNANVCKYYVEKNMTQTPLVDSLKQVKSHRYGSFCTSVEQPSAKMLEAWRKFIGK